LGVVGRVWPRHSHLARPLNSVVRRHMSLRFSIATICVFLGGCASCSSVRMLQPAAVDATSYKQQSDRERDDLFLEGSSIALWIRPCIDRVSRTTVRGTLCGTVIVPPEADFRFVSLTIESGNAAQVSPHITPQDFDASTGAGGVSRTGSDGWGVNRPYQLSGRWLTFMIWRDGEVTAPLAFYLPSFELNQARMAFPRLKVSPVMGRACYHGAW
jgi:hypothetical protein